MSAPTPREAADDRVEIVARAMGSAARDPSSSDYRADARDLLARLAHTDPAAREQGTAEAATEGGERRRRIGGLHRPDPDGTEDSWSDSVEALAESAHGLVANVDGPAQGWTQSHAWVEAADRWCARYDRVFAATSERQETREDEDVPDADALALIRAKLDLPEDATNDYTLMWVDRWIENGRTLGGTS